MKLFSTGKVPCYCEGISHRIERRKSGDTKVVDLALRIDPFNAQLAAALDPGEYGFVKRMLFKQGDASPVRDLRTVEFKPPAERQDLQCFASPDTSKASILLDHVKITKIRVRGQKDGDRWVLYLYASFGPLSKTELEYVNAFYTEQRFITFEQSDPSLEYDEEDGDEDDEVTDADEKARRPAMEFETDPVGKPVETPAAEPVRQRLKSHAGGKQKRG